ncbi:MAG TPA: trypsin-like serine protease [Planctomycetota bacterium]|nr:trypsin-like serine protease [Planctomycetota bacterium]
MRGIACPWTSLALALAVGLSLRFFCAQGDSNFSAEVDRGSERVQEIAARALEIPADRPLERWVHFSTELEREFGASESVDWRRADADVELLDASDEEFAGNLEKFLGRLRESRRDAQGYRMQIVGGEASNRFPSCVGIGNGQLICCSGVLVSPNVVVSAGHCLDESSGCLAQVGTAQVFFGAEWRPGASTSPPEGHWVAVRSIDHARNRPDGYLGAADFERDLLVLVLTETVDVEWARILPEEHLVEVSQVILSGFGASNLAGNFGAGIKREVLVPVYRANCSEADGELNCHANYELVATNLPTTRGEAMGGCHGDSGGPAFVELAIGGEPQTFVAAVVSRGTLRKLLNVECGTGTICVRLGPFEEWIRSVPGGLWP